MKELLSSKTGAALTVGLGWLTMLLVLQIGLSIFNGASVPSIEAFITADVTMTIAVIGKNALVDRETEKGYASVQTKTVEVTGTQVQWTRPGQ